MNLKNFVEWRLTHPQGYKSRNLFDKDNFVVHGRFLVTSESSTDTGISFVTDANSTASSYAQLRLLLGPASQYIGKTITFSSPSTGGTGATKIAIYSGGTSVQNGTEFAKSGDMYYSTITVEDKEYTNEVLCLLLYSHGKEPNTIIIYDEIMVNEGSEILPYEPYGKYIKR